MHVVSIEEVTIKFGEGAFHENEVNGAGGEVVFLDCRRVVGQRADAVREIGLGPERVGSRTHVCQNALLSECKLERFRLLSHKFCTTSLEPCVRAITFPYPQTVCCSRQQFSIWVCVRRT